MRLVSRSGNMVVVGELSSSSGETGLGVATVVVFAADTFVKEEPITSLRTALKPFEEDCGLGSGGD